MINKILKIIVICILLAGAPVQAAWYQVEVIVFEYLYPELGEELWYENPGLPSRDDSIELIDARPDLLEQDEENLPAPTAEKTELEPELTAYLALPKENYRLQDVYRVLRLSRDYRPLQHVAWQQAGLERREGRAVHLEKMLELEGPDSALPPELAEIQIEEEAYIAPEMVFDGTIRIRSSYYLHADVDFSYFPQEFITLLVSQKQNSVNQNNLYINQEADYVRLQESRRIKLNELHYFDHPLFGVILQVSRIEAD